MLELQQSWAWFHWRAIKTVGTTLTKPAVPPPSLHEDRLGRRPCGTSPSIDDGLFTPDGDKSAPAQNARPRGSPVMMTARISFTFEAVSRQRASSLRMISVHAFRCSGRDSVMIAMRPSAVVVKVTEVSDSSVHPLICRTPALTSSCALSAGELFICWWLVTTKGLCGWST